MQRSDGPDLVDGSVQGLGTTSGAVSMEQVLRLYCGHDRWRRQMLTEQHLVTPAFFPYLEAPARS